MLMALHTLQRRLREKSLKRRGNKCWPWLGRIDAMGNGKIWGINKYVYVPHALMLVKHNGKIPDGFKTLCCPILKDCANPDHVSLATPRDIADRVLWIKRQKRNNAKPPKMILADEIVRQIFLSTEGCVEVGKKYGISPSHVVNIRARRKYAKITAVLDKPKKEA